MQVVGWKVVCMAVFSDRGYKTRNERVTPQRTELTRRRQSTILRFVNFVHRAKLVTYWTSTAIGEVTVTV